MKKILVGILFAITFSSYCQDNITIKIISTRVILNNIEGDLYGGNKNYYSDLNAGRFDKDISYTMGGTKLVSLAKNAYGLAVSGKITVYDPYAVYISGTEVRFSVVISPSEVYSFFNSSDTTQMTYPYPPYDMHDTVFTKVFDPSQVVAIDFYETWTINSKTMDIKKKVIAYCPLIATYDQSTSEFRGLMPMFWIKM